MSAEHTRRRALRLLGHTLAEVSGGEGRVALRDHPGREVRDEVQALQRHDARRHEVTRGEEGVLQEGSHRRLAGRDGRQVLHLDRQDDVEQQEHVEAHEV